MSHTLSGIISLGNLKLNTLILAVLNASKCFHYHVNWVNNYVHFDLSPVAPFSKLFLTFYSILFLNYDVYSCPVIAVIVLHCAFVRHVRGHSDAVCLFISNTQKKIKMRSCDTWADRQTCSNAIDRNRSRPRWGEVTTSLTNGRLHRAQQLITHFPTRPLPDLSRDLRWPTSNRS